MQVQSHEGVTPALNDTDPSQQEPDRSSDISVPRPRPRLQSPHGLLTGARLNLVVCVLTLVLALIFMSDGLVPGRVAGPMTQLIAFAPWQANFPQVHPLLRGGDPILQQLPWHQWIQNEFQAGRFPLWASGPLGGYNLFASYQPGVLFPLHLLWALLPTGIGYGIIMALKLWLAGHTSDLATTPQGGR